MRCLLVLATMFALSLGSIAQATLTVELVLSEPEAGGQLKVILCASKEAYDQDKCVPQAVRADGRIVRVVYSDLRPGTYAIKVLHDINGDGRMNSNWMGLPGEPFGFSNNASIALGQPSFKAAAIVVRQGPQITRIDLR